MAKKASIKKGKKAKPAAKAGKANPSSSNGSSKARAAADRPSKALPGDQLDPNCPPDADGGKPDPRVGPQVGAATGGKSKAFPGGKLDPKCPADADGGKPDPRAGPQVDAATGGKAKAFPGDKLDPKCPPDKGKGKPDPREGPQKGDARIGDRTRRSFKLLRGPGGRSALTLSAAQKKSLLEQGFLHLPGIVPLPLVDATLRAINIALGGGTVELCPEDPEPTGISKAVSALQGTPAIDDLVLRSPLGPLAEDLLGGVAWEEKAKGWIILRYPQPAESRGKKSSFHIDGVYIHDGTIPDEAEGRIPQGQIITSSLKYMVLLNDMTAADSGNFTVCPGTHLTMARYIKKHGWEVLRKGVPKIPLGKPKQIIGRAGDAVLCHSLLVHDGAANRSPHIRYAAFFNFSQSRHSDDWRQALTDPWFEWPGLSD